MEILAVVLSVVATVIAATSLIVAWRTYLRAGARVRLRVGNEYDGTYAGGEVTWEVIAVRVSNRGLAGIQVTAVELEIWGRSGPPVPVNDDGPNLDDYMLRGMHTERWSIHVGELFDGAGLTPDEGGTARYRAAVTLGNGDRIRSEWRTHTVTAVP